MSKTPEQMAEEYCNQFSWNDPREEDAHDAFLAGYQAAINSQEKPDSCEHILDMEKMVDADKVKFCVYCNDTHKGNCAIGKGKNHPAFGFSEIVVKIESSWVSVKERLPEDADVVLIAFGGGVSIACYGGDWRHPVYPMSPLLSVTHWMPLPAAPKEEL